MICLLFVNLYKREQNTESKSFQNGWSLKEPVLEALRLLFTLKNRVLFRQSGRGGGQNCREDGELEGMLISGMQMDTPVSGFLYWQDGLEIPWDKQSLV